MGIRDHETAEIVPRLARRAGITQTALVRELASAREAELDRGSEPEDFDAKLVDFYRRFPPASPAAAPDHKPQLDAMGGEVDLESSSMRRRWSR